MSRCPINGTLRLYCSDTMAFVPIMLVSFFNLKVAKSKSVTRVIITLRFQSLFYTVLFMWVVVVNINAFYIV